MSPGAHVEIKPEWQHCYRRGGANIGGVVEAVSPSGDVARVHMDGFAPSFVRVEHLEYASLGGPRS